MCASSQIKAALSCEQPHHGGACVCTEHVAYPVEVTQQPSVDLLTVTAGRDSLILFGRSEFDGKSSFIHVCFLELGSRHMSIVHSFLAEISLR